MRSAAERAGRQLAREERCRAWLAGSGRGLGAGAKGALAVRFWWEQRREFVFRAAAGGGSLALREVAWREAQGVHHAEREILFLLGGVRCELADGLAERRVVDR